MTNKHRDLKGGFHLVIMFYSDWFAASLRGNGQNRHYKAKTRKELFAALRLTFAKNTFVHGLDWDKRLMEELDR